ncbi:rod-binding protein [Thalassovita aquimarina]|uniref:Rod-binding protein n=1 Tax=Thalassovita aquimarina TaxID=2785917 RepID=A0ABS5HL07_9RHOB|nr:rod-binding protein [Thalassovita aquimarina]MBR9649656.1 rod-binding protein [Thalassovita aquimarina]
MTQPLSLNTSLPGLQKPAQSDARPAEPSRDMARMQQAAEGFEGLFLQQMMKAGRAASLGDDLLGGTGTERMQDMLDTTLTETASGRAGLGLADAIVRQFTPFVKDKAGNA